MHIDDDQVDPRCAGGDVDPGADRAGMSPAGSSNAAGVLRAGATFDAAAAAQLRREAKALLARSVDPLVVDLTAVHTAEPAAEPAAAAVLRELAYEAGDADVDLRVVRDPAAPEVTRALLVDETLFEIYPSLDAALAGATEVPPPGEHPGQPPAPGER